MDAPYRDGFGKAGLAVVESYKPLATGDSHTHGPARLPLRRGLFMCCEEGQ